MSVQYLAADSTVIIIIMLLLLVIQFQQKAYKNCPSRREREDNICGCMLLDAGVDTVQCILSNLSTFFLAVVFGE